MATQIKTATTAQRLMSLDVMRGIIMILLAAESTRLYDALEEFKLNGIGGALVTQFFHHDWNGLRFWDLVQPGFMLMAGSAMYISYHYKTLKGITWAANLKHIAIRCLKLFICGVGLHCVYNGKLVWELWNVLTQLAFTIMIAYLIIRWSYRQQLIFSFGLLLLAEILYRFTNMPGYDQPFVKDQNFGSFMDMVTMGKLNNGGGWVFINIITTAAHTIWGVLAGKLLISKATNAYKMKALIVAGVTGLVLGYGLDFAGITPIIKRIATSSFTLASGGWILLIMAFLYWLTDIKKQNKNAWLFTVVGMNPIFIYLFFETVGGQWLNKTVRVFVGGFSEMLGAGEHWQLLLSAIVTLFILWYICYWLYKKKIFFKL